MYIHLSVLYLCFYIYPKYGMLFLYQVSCLTIPLNHLVKDRQSISFNRLLQPCRLTSQSWTDGADRWARLLCVSYMYKTKYDTQTFPKQSLLYGVFALIKGCPR